MLDIMYEIPSDPSIESVIITGECIEDGCEPVITHSNVSPENSADLPAEENEGIEPLDLDAVSR